MIVYSLPKRIRYIPASNIFKATFNAPTIGKYNFNSQVKIFIPRLLPNSVYLIDAFSIAGNIAEADFLDAIETTPVLTLEKSLNNENIFDNSIQIQNYSTDKQITHFFKTGLSNTGLNAKISGILKQTGALIGKNEISLSVNFSIHAIDESDFEKTFSRQG